MFLPSKDSNQRIAAQHTKSTEQARSLAVNHHLLGAFVSEKASGKARHKLVGHRMRFGSHGRRHNAQNYGDNEEDLQSLHIVGSAM